MDTSIFDLDVLFPELADTTEDTKGERNHEIDLRQTICNERHMNIEDLNRITNVNAHQFTATFNTGFYFEYICNYPEQTYIYCTPGISNISVCKGYMIAKDEGRSFIDNGSCTCEQAYLQASTNSKREYHSHISAVTVAPEWRRSGVARRLIVTVLEERLCNSFLHCDFLDLFVRKGNKNAIEMYYRLGYMVYRIVENYYTNSDDAYDMRKSTICDRKGVCTKELQRKEIRKWIPFLL